MKKTRKLIVALVLVMSILMTLAVAVIPASAVTFTGGITLYLKPNSNWTQANARFAVYLCNGTSTAKWYSMSDSNGDGIYEATIPSGRNDKNIIFCRMNPSTTTNDWSNKWNQTGDLVWDGTNDLCIINDDQWDCGTNVTWIKHDNYGKSFLAGSFNNWNTVADEFEVIDGMLTVSVELAADTDYQFKYLTNGTWYGCTANIKESVSDYKFYSSNSNNCNLKTECAGTYTFTLDASSNLLSITYPEHTLVNGECKDCDYVAQSFEEAITGTGTITLTDDVNYGEETLVIPNEVTINLNGHTLTANGVVSFNEGTRFVGEGKLVIPQDKRVLAGEADNMPIWVGDGYVFNEVKDQANYEVTGDTTFNVVFRPSFGTLEENRELLGNTEINAGLTFEIQIWNGGEKVFYGDVSDDLVKEAYANDQAIRISVKGATTGATYTVKLVIKSDMGLTNTANLATVTVSVPEVEETPAE